MKISLRGTLTAIVLAGALAVGSVQAAVVWNGGAAWWGQSPPESPFFGQSWISTAVSSDNPLQSVYDGTGWNVVGVCTTGCTGVYAVATATTNPPISPGVCSIASATTTSVGTTSCPIVVVTGTTTITNLGTPAAGVTDRILVFTGALTFTYGATAIILPKDANITTQIGDVAVMHSVGGSLWRLLSYQTAPIFP